jgi:GxxExxY protein
MHPDFQRADQWSPLLIGGAIEVHREKGLGLLESIYQQCLMRELTLREIPAERELVVPITYKGVVFEEPLRLDFYVDKCLIVEAKAVEKLLPIHVAQVLSYMRLLNAPIGLLINFHEIVLKDGIRRLTLKGADRA